MALSIVCICSDYIQMASYAPMFVNEKDRTLVLMDFYAFASTSILVHDNCTDCV